MELRCHCKRVVSWLLSLFFAAFVHADELDEESSEVLQVPRILVSPHAQIPTLTAPSAFEADRKLRQIPGGTSVTPAEEYRSGRVSTIQDSLGFTPGVFVQSRFGSEESRLSIRGSGLQRTFHGRGIRVLLDGVPLNLADGSFDFQAIEPLATEYAEVFRGASALHLGSMSLGGAVNFVSPVGTRASPFLMRLEGGSFQYWRGQLSSADYSDSMDSYHSLTSFAQEGFREHSRQNTQRIFGNWGWRLRPQTENRVYITYVNSRSEIPGAISKDELNENPRRAQRAVNPMFDVIENDYRRDFSYFRLADKLTFQWSRSRLETSVYGSYKDLDHPILFWIRDHSLDLGTQIRYVHEGTLFGRANEWSLGLIGDWGEVRDRRYANNSGARGSQTADNRQTASGWNLFFENRFEWQPKWTFVAGGLWSQAVRENKDLFPVSGSDLDNSDTQTYTGFSPRVGLIYSASETVQLYTNYSSSFEPPTFGELVTVTGQEGLLPLDAQTANTIEIGSRGSWHQLFWDFSYYYARVDGELLSYEVSPGVTRTVNAQQTVHEGVELGWGVLFKNQWNWRHHFLWNHFYFDSDPVYGNNAIAGIPEYYYKGELSYEASGGFYLGPSWEAVLSPYPVDFANTYYAFPYTIWGFKAGVRRPRGISWFLEGRNLFDMKYAATTGVVPTANAFNRNQFYPGDGASVYLGAQWAL